MTPTDTFKLKAVNIRRLRKLIAFLRQLPRKRFNFSIIRNEPPKCGAVGCAIGYMPNVFPRVFRSFPVPVWEGGDWTHGVGFRGSEDASFSQAAVWVSGLDYDKATALFEPGNQKTADERLPELNGLATPKQVAQMLEKFITLHT